MLLKSDKNVGLLHYILICPLKVQSISQKYKPVLVLFARFWRFWKLIELLFFRVLFLVSTHHLAKFSSINLTENIYYHRFIELKGDRGPSSFWCLRNRHFNHDHKRKYILVISELSLQESTKSSIFDIWYLQLVKLD